MQTPKVERNPDELKALVEGGGLEGGILEEAADLDADELDFIDHVDELGFGEVFGLFGEDLGGVEAVFAGVFVAGLAAGLARGREAFQFYLRG